jgi:hypothetical protein
MEKPRLHPEQPVQEARERAREDMRRVLSKRADALLEGTGFTVKRPAGEPFALHAEELPRKQAGETEDPKPVTFDGFEAVGLSIEEIREALDPLLETMATSVRFSRQPAVKVVDGKFIVAEYREKPVGHVRIDILPLDESDMPNKQDILDLLQRQAVRVSQWGKEGMSAEDIALVLSTPRATRRDWIEAAAVSLATRMDPEQALAMAARIVDDVIAMRNRV